MDKNFKEMAANLTIEIQETYESGVTMESAEKLAAKFLHAQIVISDELSVVDIDARMKRAGTKALKASVYLAEVEKVDKKPSDTMLEALVLRTREVQEQVTAEIHAEVDKDQLINYFQIFKEAHIYFRGIAKGRFE